MNIALNNIYILLQLIIIIYCSYKQYICIHFNQYIVQSNPTLYVYLEIN